MEKKERNAEICRLYNSGIPSTHLAETFGLCYQRIMQIVKRDKYRAYSRKYKAKLRAEDGAYQQGN